MTFEFNNQFVPQNILEIPELGQFAIEATNDQGYCWYMVLKTSLGNSTIAECGPVFPDIILLPDGYKTELTKMPYKEDKIGNKVNFWLNDRKKAITSAQVIDIEAALKQFRDLADYFKNVNEEMY